MGHRKLYPIRSLIADGWDSTNLNSRVHSIVECSLFEVRRPVRSCPKIVNLRKGFVVGHQDSADRNGMGCNLKIHVLKALGGWRILSFSKS
jgi:hypothetical protein